jgi:hypothetical protein
MPRDGRTPKAGPKRATLARDAKAVKRLPSGQAWLEMTFTGTPEALRTRLTKLEAATGVIFGTSGAGNASRSITRGCLDAPVGREPHECDGDVKCDRDPRVEESDRNRDDIGCEG